MPIAVIVLCTATKPGLSRAPPPPQPTNATPSAHAAHTYVFLLMPKDPRAARVAPIAARRAKERARTLARARARGEDRGMRECPICGAKAGDFPDNAHAPFCSERCKLVDLGNWLDQGYRVASS